MRGKLALVQDEAAELRFRLSTAQAANDKLRDMHADAQSRLEQELDEGAKLRQRLRALTEDVAASVLVAASVDAPAPVGRVGIPLRLRTTHPDDEDGTASPGLMTPVSASASATPMTSVLGQARPSMDEPHSPMSTASREEASGARGSLDSSRGELKPGAGGSTSRSWLGWAKDAALYAVSPVPRMSTTQTKATTAPDADRSSALHDEMNGAYAAACDVDGLAAVNASVAASDAFSDGGSSSVTDAAATAAAPSSDDPPPQPAPAPAPSATGITADQALRLGSQGKLTGAAVSDMALHASWARGWAGGEDSAPGVAPIARSPVSKDTTAKSTSRSSSGLPSSADTDTAALLAAAAGQRRPRKAKARAVEL